VHGANARVRGREPIDDGARRVRRSIVDDDQLEVRIVARELRACRGLQRCFLVAGGTMTETRGQRGGSGGACGSGSTARMPRAVA